MIRTRICVGAAFVVLAGAAWAGPTEEAHAVLERAGIRGGLVVHLGCGDGRLTAALRASDAYLVHGLDADPARVETARARIRRAGLYGPVSVEHLAGDRLPYVDNLVNLVVVSDPGPVPAAEVMRVLAPGGVACVRQGDGWEKRIKPWPAGIDQWPQYLHGADNNAVARDTVVGPPRHLQWTTAPRWSRSHMTIPTVAAMVSADGRLFTIEDRATPENPFLPGRWALVARDAFNGLLLWRYDFPDWEPITRYAKDIAVQLQRRLAAVRGIVYCTPGLEAPLTAFDAATGEILKTYPGTERTQELAYHDGVLYLVTGDRMNSARYNIVKTQAGKGRNTGGLDPRAPFGGTGWRGAYARETPDLAHPVCSIVALRADSGEARWRIEDLHGYIGATLAIRGPYAVYQTAHGLVCLDPETGRTRWRVEKAIPSGDGTSPNTVVLSDTMVYAQEGRSLVAYALADGSPRWKAPIAANYEKSADLFLAAGAVWTGGAGRPTAYDPLTGTRLGIYSQGMTGPMGHDRCYRNFITERFYINSKTGGADFLALDGGREFPNHWTRGTCGMGVLPCNGLLYAPPYSCQCSIGAMVVGMNAFAAETGLASPNQPIPIETRARLVEGEAYGVARDPKARSSADDWPTYRHDATRGGATACEVPPPLVPRWKVRLRTRPSAPVIADGKVFVAEVDAHTVCALDADDGRVRWTYTAGARVDSPPTFHRGLVLFGARDGWVHCLRAADGRLVWRFKDLPERWICASGQLESAWPVRGSVLVAGDLACFAAGRSSFLDGGIVLYALRPETGEVVHRRRYYGPFDERTGFPATNHRGFKADILVSDGRLLYLRHKAFTADLRVADASRPHVIASAGFLDPVPQHRTYWTVATGFRGKTAVAPPSGDILVTDGKTYYEVEGFPVHRHSYFDPRLRGYKLLAGALRAAGAPRPFVGRKRRRGGSARSAEKWSTYIPMTGRAMVLAGDVVFVAGTPACFPPDHPVAAYEAAYAGRLGGVLWAASARDGTKLASYRLEAPPVWDGLAATRARLYLALKDGSVCCMGPRR